MNAPSIKQIEDGSKAFRKHERRDALYKTASFLVDHFWGQPDKMADGLGVLLLTWNQAFYRYGIFDFSLLEACIRSNFATLETYRHRNILDYTSADDLHIRRLFGELLGALAIADGTKKGSRSAVAVAKALHMVAPNFFPLWDKRIAKSYGCDYSRNPVDRYILFFRKTRDLASGLSTLSCDNETTILKLIDEYNYAKFTKGWV